MDNAGYGVLMDRGGGMMDGRGMDHRGADDSILGDPENSPDELGSLDDDDEDEMGRDKNGQPKSKKRRKYINKACDNCRTRHSRCDGKEPCAPCSKKGFQCGYSAPPSRRGPVSERQLQELITSLTKQIESEKKMKKDWKDKFYQKTGGPGSPPSSAGGGGGGGGPFSPSSDGGGAMPTDSFNTSVGPAGYGGGGSSGGGDMMAAYGGGGGSGGGGGWASSSSSSSSSTSTAVTADPAQASAIAMYIDAYQRYISRHISAHEAIFEPGAALRVVTSNQRTPLAFQLYAVLANGARVTGHQAASMDFAMKARRTLGAVFDQTDGLVAQGLMILAYYMSGQAEADKTMYYLQLARKMCQHLDTRSSDYYMLILMTIGLASPHHEEKLEVFTELKMRLEPLLSNTITPGGGLGGGGPGGATNGSGLNRNFTLTLAIISVQAELEMAKLRMDYNADYAVMLQVLEKLEKMLAGDKSGNYSKLSFRIFLEVIRAQCYCALGLREMAVECTNEVSELAKHPEFPYVPVVVLAGIEMMALIQLEEGRYEQVRDHIQRLAKLAATYPSVRLIVQRLNDAFQEKASKSAYEPSRAALGSLEDHGSVGPMSGGMTHMGGGGGGPPFGQQQLGGPGSAGSTSSPLFPGQDRAPPGLGGGGSGLPPFMQQNDMSQRRMPGLGADPGGGGSGGLPPFPGGGNDLAGSRGVLEGLGDGRSMMSDRGGGGYPPKPDHLGYDARGGRLGGLPPHLAGDRGGGGLGGGMPPMVDDPMSRERAMAQAGLGPHHGYGQSSLEQQQHQQQQHELDYRLQQERAMLDRRLLAQQQQHQQQQQQQQLPPHLMNLYGGHAMGGPRPGGYGGGPMLPDMMRGGPGPMSHPSSQLGGGGGGPMGMGGRGLPGMPGPFGPGGSGGGMPMSAQFGGPPMGGGHPSQQQQQMPGMGPRGGPWGGGGGYDAESSMPRHHLPPPLHHQPPPQQQQQQQQQQYMMYNSEQQDD